MQARGQCGAALLPEWALPGGASVGRHWALLAAKTGGRGPTTEANHFFSSRLIPVRGPHDLKKKEKKAVPACLPLAVSCTTWGIVATIKTVECESTTQASSNHMTAQFTSQIEGHTLLLFP